MSAKRAIAALLESACERAEAIRLVQARQVVRQAWAKEIRAAEEAVDAAWDRRLDEMEAEGIDPHECQDLPELPEEEALTALLAQANAVRDHDRWPRELYWGGI